MPLTPVPHPGFGGGLNLRDQPDVVNPAQAIDLMNATMIERGAVKQRDGYGLFTASPGTNRYDSLTEFYTVAGTKQLVAGAGNRLEGISTAGAVVASSAAPTANPHFFTRFGGPTAQLVYCANGTDQLRTWDGAAFATPGWTGTAPTGKFVAVTPWDNRLVNARRGGAVAGDNPSTVRFSDQGVPTTWGANNFFDVSPGDGEEITGMAVFNEQLFVFKNSRFVVFYGTSADSSGNPVFVERPVDAKVGACSPKAIAVGRDGVYFLNQRGVYRTSGGAPELVSPLLDPFFYGGASDFYLGGVLNQGALDVPAMAWHQERIYLSVPVGTSTTNNRVLVYDPLNRWWSLYDIPAAALTQFRIGSQFELVFAYAAGTKDLGRHSSSFTTDAGVTIPSRWSSGWFDYGQTAMKTIREAKVWGKGNCIVGLGHDYAINAAGAVVNFSSGLPLYDSGILWDGGSVWTDTSLIPKLVRGIAVRGTVFNLSIRNNGVNPWAIYRWANHVRGQRDPSIVRTEV